MRIAVINDIHGNLPALEAVLEEIEAEQVDVIVVGGDVIAGPLPNEAIAKLREMSSRIQTYFIHGNHESELLRFVADEPLDALSPRAVEEAEWLATQLNPAEIQFIESWVSSVKLELEGLGEVLFCHATPHDDITVFMSQTPEERVLSIFENVSAAIVVCGHTHMQFERMVGDIRVVNAGSVGLPFGHTGADWVLIDDGIQLRHTAYDLEEAAQRIRESNYPHAEGFADNVLQGIPIEAAMEMLTQLEAQQRE